jgi:ubiquinone biosynthesis protein UbiJ
MRLLGPQPEAALRTGSVHIHGDAEVAQTFSELLKAARPDLEEELSRLIGDVAAHQIGNAARSLVGFAQRSVTTFTQNISEFLQEEGRDVPSRTEAEEFIRDVDRLRDDVDRIEARIVMLETKAGAGRDS